MDITPRVLAMLRAVEAGHVEMTCSCEPDLTVSGCPVCDQYTGHHLATDGLIRPATPGAIGQRVRAELTEQGRALLAGRPEGVAS